jgi:hypothetical protein
MYLATNPYGRETAWLKNYNPNPNRSPRKSEYPPAQQPSLDFLKANLTLNPPPLTS